MDGWIGSPMLPDSCNFDWLALDLLGTFLGDSTRVGFVPSQSVCGCCTGEVESGLGGFNFHCPWRALRLPGGG